MDFSSVNMLHDPLSPQKLPAPAPSCRRNSVSLCGVWRTTSFPGLWACLCVWPIVRRREWRTVWNGCNPPLHTVQPPASLHPTSFQSSRLKTPNLFICSCWESWFVSLIILVICLCSGVQSPVSRARTCPLGRKMERKMSQDMLW